MKLPYLMCSLRVAISSDTNMDPTMDVREANHPEPCGSMKWAEYLWLKSARDAVITC